MNAQTPSGTPDDAKIRLAILTNILAPYWKAICECLTSCYRLRVFLSTPMESNRPWQIDWGDINVVVQRAITLHRRWKHPSGFVEPIYVHFPIDTISQLRRFRAQVTISNELGFRTLLVCLYRKLARSSRLLVLAEMAESTERGRGRSRMLLRRLLKGHIDGFLVPGQSGARYVRSLGVPQSKIFRIGYTTDFHRFCEMPVTRPAEIAYRLLYVGQLIERKGLFPLFTILSKWASEHPQRTLEFTLVGDGPSRARLEEASLPSNFRSTFRGNMAFQDLPGMYAECGIFVFPTLADTWGVVVNEAMAAGLPVLGSIYSQAVEEMVEDGQNGWSFAPDNPASVYSAVERALSGSSESLNRMRQYARETAMRYTPEIVARNISNAVHQVLGQA